MRPWFQAALFLCATAFATVQAQTPSSSGDLFWTGPLKKDQLITVTGLQASAGTIAGKALPGRPASIRTFSSAVAIVEQPGAQNGWTRFSFRALRDIKQSVSVNFRWALTGNTSPPAPAPAPGPATPAGPRPPPATPSVTGTPAGPAATPPAVSQPAAAAPGCGALVAWMGTLEREVPDVDFARTALGPKVYDKVLNLFRDEHFRPLFGKPFSETTAAERLSFHRSVFRPCGPQQLSPDQRATLNRLKLIVEPPFLRSTGAFSAAVVMAGLTERAALLAWTQQAMETLPQIPPTPGGLAHLEGYIQRAAADLDKLWPRERDAFLSAIRNRHELLAKSLEPAPAPQPAPAPAPAPPPTPTVAETGSPAGGKRPPPSVSTGPAATPSAPAPVVADTPEPAQTQACDTFAAHPDDPARVAEGIPDDAIQMDEAIEACVLAAEAAPETARFHFQRGRAYWAAGLHEDAVDAFLAAEDYPPAYFYLGQAYEGGRVPDEPADAAFAGELYHLAAEGGFLPAIERVAPDALAAAAPLEFDPAVFVQPGLMEPLHTGDVPSLNEGRYATLIYVSGLLSLMVSEAAAYDACPDKLDNKTVDAIVAERTGSPGQAFESFTDAFIRLLHSDPSVAVDNLIRDVAFQDRLFQDGIDDAFILLQDYGGCAGDDFDKVYKTIKRLTTEKSAVPLFGLGELSSLNHRPPQPSDVQGVEDPATLARLHREIEALAAKGHQLVACDYRSGETSRERLFWYVLIPPLSEELRNALPGILPGALYTCPRRENVFKQMHENLTGTSPHPVFPNRRPFDARNDQKRRPSPFSAAHKRYSRRAYEFQQAGTQLLECRHGTDKARPSLFWYATLPSTYTATYGHATDSGFLKFMRDHYRIAPAALESCPVTAQGASLFEHDANWR